MDNLLIRLRCHLANKRTLVTEVERLLKEVRRLEAREDALLKITRFWQNSYRESETKPPSTAKGA